MTFNWDQFKLSNNQPKKEISVRDESEYEILRQWYPVINLLNRRLMNCHVRKADTTAFVVIDGHAFVFTTPLLRGNRYAWKCAAGRRHACTCIFKDQFPFRVRNRKCTNTSKINKHSIIQEIELEVVETDVDNDLFIYKLLSKEEEVAKKGEKS